MKVKDEEIVELFFDVVKRNRRCSEKRHGRMHPFRGQYLCLQVLSNAGEMNQKDLAGMLGIRPSSAGELTAKLEQKGLVKRDSRPPDRRSIIVSLTEEGMRTAKEAEKNRAKFHSDMLEELTEEEKEAFYGALKKIKHHYEKMEQKNESENRRETCTYETEKKPDLY